MVSPILLYLCHDFGEGYAFQTAKQSMCTEFVATNTRGADAAQKPAQQTRRCQNISLLLF